VLHSWSFAQLKMFLVYKAALAGVNIVEVAPHNSSRQCWQCGHTSKQNRPSQSQFLCRRCGYAAHADHNAALNLRERGRATVNWPIVARVASGDLPSQLQATGFQPVCG
jgi:transposase